MTGRNIETNKGLAYSIYEILVLGMNLPDDPELFFFAAEAELSTVSRKGDGPDFYRIAENLALHGYPIGPHMLGLSGRNWGGETG